MDLISIYWFSILASATLGGGLALLGAQLAARDRAMQSICISQSAVLGVLLGIGLCQVWMLSPWIEHLIPFASAVVVAILTVITSERLIIAKASATTHFVAIFVVLLASGYFISALFPGLESYMAQKYFGDLATMSHESCVIAFYLGSVVLLLQYGWRRQLTRDSFAHTILGRNPNNGNLKFAVGTILGICLAVQTVGFLFTVACLFLPTSILAVGPSVGLQRHLFSCLVIGMVASIWGFVITLWFTMLPTVPVIVLCMVVSGISLNWLQRFIASNN